MRGRQGQHAETVSSEDTRSQSRFTLEHTPGRQIMTGLNHSDGICMHNGVAAISV